MNKTEKIKLIGLQKEITVIKDDYGQIIGLHISEVLTEKEFKKHYPDHPLNSPKS